jgi:hypothetical protein
MRAAKCILFAISGVLAAGSPARAADTAGISGNYVETRAAEVFAGPCMSNSEENLVGDQAILAWHVAQGSWEGVPLAGLGVAAAVKASGTIGAPDSDPYPAKAVLFVDERATPEQRRALEDMARAKAGRLLEDVVAVEAAPIRFEERAHGSVLFAAGNKLKVETRSMKPGDHICGNEAMCYLPLTRLAHSMPAFTLVEQFAGKGLGVTWSISGKSSSFVGNFKY